MNTYNISELKTLLTDSLCEKQGSYIIEELFQQFLTTAELVDVTEQELIRIKGIGKGKAGQITAMLKLAKTLTLPTCTPYTIRSPKDVFHLLNQTLDTYKRNISYVSF